MHVALSSLSLRKCAGIYPNIRRLCHADWRPAECREADSLVIPNSSSVPSLTKPSHVDKLVAIFNCAGRTLVSLPLPQAAEISKVKPTLHPQSSFTRKASAAPRFSTYSYQPTFPFTSQLAGRSLAIPVLSAAHGCYKAKLRRSRPLACASH